MIMNFKLFLRIFFIFCLIFGFINIAIGGFALYGYYKVQKTLSTASLEVNQSISTAKALFANVTRLTSTASTQVGPVSRNITSLITGLEARLSISKQEFYNESNYFSTFQLPDSSSPSLGISKAFKNIGDQLNVTQTQYLPPILNAVNSGMLEANGSIQNINYSISRLNQSFSLIASNVLSEIGTANGIISLAVLGFAFYSILEGIIFIMLSTFILYLTKNRYGSRKQPPTIDEENASAKTYPDTTQNAQSGSRSRRKGKGVDQSAAETNQEGPGKGGLMKTIKDAFGIEE